MSALSAPLQGPKRPSGWAVEFWRTWPKAFACPPQSMSVSYLRSPPPAPGRSAAAWLLTSNRLHAELLPIARPLARRPAKPPPNRLPAARCPLDSFDLVDFALSGQEGERERNERCYQTGERNEEEKNENGVIPSIWRNKHIPHLRGTCYLGESVVPFLVSTKHRNEAQVQVQPITFLPMTHTKHTVGAGLALCSMFFFFASMPQRKIFL